MNPTPQLSPAPLYLLRHPRWLVAYLFGWLLVGIWLGTNVWINQRYNPHPIPVWQLYTWEISSAMVVGPLALAVAWFEARWRITGPGALRRLPVHLPAAVIFSLVHVLLIVMLRKGVYRLMGQHYDFGGYALGFVYEFQKDLITYASIAAVCALIRVLRERRRQQLDELELRRALSEARLAHLSAQIEPHFVFNTLNAISNRMYEDVPAADRMIVALADLLRTAMTADGSAFVRVADEARWLQAYTALMAERQPGLLDVRIDIAPGLETMRLPRLLLQPLVENAFRHGLRNGRGQLRIALQRDGDQLACWVEDDGAGLPPTVSPGVGLRNVRERLQLLYPGKHSWSIAARDGGGTVAHIRLPLEPWPGEVAA